MGVARSFSSPDKLLQLERNRKARHDAIQRGENESIELIAQLQMKITQLREDPQADKLSQVEPCRRWKCKSLPNVK